METLGSTIWKFEVNVPGVGVLYVAARNWMDAQRIAVKGTEHKWNEVMARAMSDKKSLALDLPVNVDEEGIINVEQQ